MKTAAAGSAALVRGLIAQVNRKVELVCREKGLSCINFMEVCGTHTMAISGSGIRRAVDERLRLLSGPGCPVCVTTQEEIDAAIALARLPDLTVVTFGDMIRVPGSSESLEQARAMGGDVRVVYSALDALSVAAEEPERRFVFLGVGFETTAPTIAAAVLTARKRRLRNFSVLPMFKLIPPALRSIAGSKRVNIDGFILPGHVSVVIGVRPYQFIARDCGMPCCITGFEAMDVAQGILVLLEQMLGKPEVAIQYRRTVKPNGNPEARRVMDAVFKPVDAAWRGIGLIPGSGLGFRAGFARFDGSRQFRALGHEPNGADGLGHDRGSPGTQSRFRGRNRVMSPAGCRCGDVMLGMIVPPECSLFGRRCTPARPVGPCMVSSEGACAAYYRYDR